MAESDEIICRICLNDSFDSDLKYLNRQHIKNIPTSLESFGKLISPCKCSGSIGFIHRGCLLLEVQYRKTSTCHLCLANFHHIRTIQRNNSVFAYARRNKVRTLLAILYLTVIPVLTTYWFVNKLRVSANISRYWNMTYQEYNLARRQQISSYPELHLSANGDPNSNNNNNNNYKYNHHDRKQQKLVLRHTTPDQMINTHPLVYLIFAYHWDVLWINLANLLLIQLVISSITHYQEWAFQNRPITQIELIDD